MVNNKIIKIKYLQNIFLENVKKRNIHYLLNRLLKSMMIEQYKKSKNSFNKKWLPWGGYKLLLPIYPKFCSIPLPCERRCPTYRCSLPGLTGFGGLRRFAHSLQSGSLHRLTPQDEMSTQNLGMSRKMLIPPPSFRLPHETISGYRGRLTPQPSQSIYLYLMYIYFSVI